MHVVDLDGAKGGNLANFELVCQIAAQSGLFVEAGGGIRDEERILRYLDAGIGRVILGTAALQDTGFLEKMVKKYAAHIAVGVDARRGMAATHGWEQTSEMNAVDFCRRCAAMGVKTVIYTDIAKDGALAGTNLAVYEQLAQIKELQVIASGGITYLEELTALKSYGIQGAILGKALYAGRFTLREALNRV